MRRPRVIVFDLGGVLLDYAPERRVAAIAAACRTDEESVRAFLAGPLVRDLDAGLATPDHLARDLGHLAEGRLGVDPSDILFVDDAYRNVTAARSRGWNALHYRSPEQLLADLRRNVLT